MAATLPATRRYDLLFAAMNQLLAVLADDGDERAALERSFEATADGFGARNALLLLVEGVEPLALACVHARGTLTRAQTQACERGESVKGVSPSVIRRVAQGGQAELIADPRLRQDAGRTTSLEGGDFSVSTFQVKGWSFGGARRGCAGLLPGDGGGSSYGSAVFSPNFAGTLRFTLGVPAVGVGGASLGQATPTRLWLDNSETRENQILVIGGGGDAGCSSDGLTDGGGGDGDGRPSVGPCIAGGGFAQHLTDDEGGRGGEFVSGGGCSAQNGGGQNGKVGLGSTTAPYEGSQCANANNSETTSCSGAGISSGGSGARAFWTGSNGVHIGGAGGGRSKQQLQPISLPELVSAFTIPAPNAPVPANSADPDRSEQNPNFCEGCPDPLTPSYGMGYGAHGLSNVRTASRMVFVWSTAGDLNGDGKADLFLRKGANWQHDVWFMNGVSLVGSAASLNPQPNSATEADKQDLSGVNDFNADGYNDLVFWNRTTAATEFWFMGGAEARIAAPVPISADPNDPGPTHTTDWLLAATADFNHDTKPDLVWRNKTSTQDLKIWTMNGTAWASTVTPSPDHAVNANWQVVAAADYGDGVTAAPGAQDGNTDLLWYNSTSGKIVIWYMDGSVVRTSGVFTVPDSAGNANWKVLAGGDYGVFLNPPTGPYDPTPDGRPDVVWRNATSGKFVVWLMDSAGNRTSGLFTTPDSPQPTPTDWTIVGPR